MGRFILTVCMAFATAFVGISWATRGFPAYSPPPISVGELQQTLDAHFSQHDPVRARKDWEAEHTARGDDDAKRNAIRLDTLQAANAYAMSPCDKTMKSNLIEAVTAYVRAWQKKMDCPRPLDMLVFCSDQRIKEVATTFSTPLDLRVQAALMKAFEQKGIVKADFPESIRFDVLKFAGPGLWVDESPLSMPRLRASAQAGTR